MAARKSKVTEGIKCIKIPSDFTKLNCLVFGISKDSLKKHQNFIKKSNLLVNLLLANWQSKTFSASDNSGTAL